MSDPRSTTRESDVVVVGDGLVGRSAAVELSRLGLDVEVVTSSAPGASSAAAGMLAPLSESRAGTSFQFVCLGARDRWPAWREELEEQTGVDLRFSQTPTLLPAFDDRRHRELETLQRHAEVAGEDVAWAGPAEVYQRVPHLAPRCVGGLLLRNEPRVDPRRVLEALGHILDERSVPIHRHREVVAVVPGDEGVELRGTDWRKVAPRVVVACGAWAARIEGLGLGELVRPVRGQMIAFRDDGSWEGCIRHGHHYALTRAGEVLFGATEEESGFVDETTDEGIDELRDAAERLLPRLRWRRILRRWSGLRPATRDLLPILGHWRSESLVVATGGFRNGVLLAPWTARVIAELVVDGASPSLPRELSAERFAPAEA